MENNIPTIDLGTPKAPGSNQPMRPAVEEVKFEPLKSQNSLSHGELLKALYFVFDGLTSFGLSFFPVRDTARAMLKQIELDGDTIDIGLRKLEWTSDFKSIVESYFQEDHGEIVKENTEEEIFLKDGVTIHFHFYSDNECISYLSSIDYEYERWNIPQNFEKFCELYDK